MTAFLLALMLSAPTAPAIGLQTTVPTVEAGKAFSLLADYSAADAANVVGFQLYVDGNAVRTLMVAQAWANGLITVPAITITVLGPHTLALSAFNATGDTMSAPLSISVVSPTTPPSKPSPATNLRIIK